MKIAFFALLFVLSVDAAQAMMPSETQPSGLVRYDDLDLRNAHDAQILRQRIDRTIISLSGDDITQPGSLFERPDVEEARARGQQQADSLIRAAYQWPCARHK